MRIKYLESRPRAREYLLVIIVLIIIGLVEGRNILGLLVGNIGIGDFSYYSLPFNEIERFHYFPLVAIDWLRIPSPLAIGLLMVFYHVLGGFFAYCPRKTILHG